MTDNANLAGLLHWIDTHLSGSANRGKAHTTWHEVFAACESPIERLMAEGLRTTAADNRYELLPAWSDAARGAIVEKLAPDVFWLIGQRKIGRYRADFVVIGKGRDEDLLALVVECDGQAFHADNLKQIVRDRKRDTEMRDMGLSVIRFSGSEITRDGEGCAARVFDRFRATPVFSEDDSADV